MVTGLSSVAGWYGVLGRPGAAGPGGGTGVAAPEV